MFELVLSLFGIGQSLTQRAEERKLHAAAILAKVDATILEAALRLDYEIPRLARFAANRSISPKLAVASLVSMREQCDQLQSLVEENRALLHSKGANAAVITELERWAGTCSVIPTQIDVGVQKIELAITNNAGQILG